MQVSRNPCFDIQTTNTNAPSQSHTATERMFIKHEKDKRRQDNMRIMHVEQATFTLLVCSVNGGMAATLLKVTLLHGCFSCFLNCTNATKSRKASHICP